MPARRKISLWELKKKYRIIALERGAARVGVSPGDFMRELGQIF